MKVGNQMMELVEIIYDLIKEETHIKNVIGYYVEGSPKLVDSKVGGLAYVNDQYPRPLTRKGHPMVLLAQINFSQVPKSHIPFPDQGLLQFWVKDDLVSDESMDDLSKVNKVVRYIPFIDEDIDDQAIKASDLKEVNPSFIKGAYKLAFDVAEDFYSMNASYKYEDLFISLWNQSFPDLALDHLSDDMRQHLFDLDEKHYVPFSQYMVRLGGFPYVYSADPSAPDYATSLLTLEGFDLDDDHFLDFGPNGLAHFLIRPEDLTALNFDQVFFFWEY